MSDDTHDDIDALIDRVERLHQAGTPGPWQARFLYRVVHTVRRHARRLGLLLALPDRDWADAELVAAYREAAPLLARLLRDARAAAERLAQDLDRVTGERDLLAAGQKDAFLETVLRERDHAQKVEVPDALDRADRWREVAPAFRDALSPEAEAARQGEHDPYLPRAQDLFNAAAARDGYKEPDVPALSDALDAEADDWSPARAQGRRPAPRDRRP